MKRQGIVLLLLVLLKSSFVFSQIKEGKVDFIVSYPNSELPKESLSMLPNHTVLWFKNEQSRFDMKMAMGMNMSTITDNKNMVILMDILGKKTAIKKQMADLAKTANSNSNKSKVTLTSEVKDIAGYHCKKATINSEDGEIEIWFTTEIFGNNSWNESFKGIKGFPMEFNMKTGQMEMHLIAEKVYTEKVEDSVFIVPNDYVFLSDAETKAMFDGFK